MTSSDEAGSCLVGECMMLGKLGYYLLEFWQREKTQVIVNAKNFKNGSDRAENQRKKSFWEFPAAIRSAQGS